MREVPQEVYDRPMLEVNKRLLKALHPWDANICSNIRDKENFKYLEGFSPKKLKMMKQIR